MMRGISKSTLHRFASQEGGKLVAVNHQLHVNNSRTSSVALSIQRRYASQTSIGASSPEATKRHQKVTVLNDDGRVPWGNLTPREKLARTTQQSFNFTLVIGGAILTGLVITYLFTDVFSPQSPTAHFNRAVDRVRTDEKSTSVLGVGKDIRAYGEPTLNKWRRNRPIASRIQTDRTGNQLLVMHFNVSGPLNEGIVHLRMVRRNDDNEFHYGSLALDVPGQPRIWLENADAEKKSSTRGVSRFLGSRR